MSHASARVLTPLLALAILVVSGCCSTAGQRRPPGSIHSTIRVGPRASDLTIDTLRLSRSRRDVVSWISTDPAKTLFIEFTEQPFENMKQQDNRRYRVECRGHRCDSGEIKQGAEFKEYKYWQILVEHGVPEEVDGMIIIVP